MSGSAPTRPAAGAEHGVAASGIDVADLHLVVDGTLDRPAVGVEPVPLEVEGEAGPVVEVVELVDLAGHCHTGIDPRHARSGCWWRRRVLAVVGELDDPTVRRGAAVLEVIW